MQQDAPFAARRTHLVPRKIDDITISVKKSRKQSELGPVADNFCGPNIFAPLETGQKRCDNMQAAQLAVNDNIRLSMLTKKFSETFLKYHKACVEVILTTERGGAIRGSGFLCKTSNSRVILITAAHIVPALDNSGFIVIESDYQYLSQFHDQIQARKVTIPISCCGFKINAALDTAVIWLNASMSLIELIDEFPYLSLASASSASNMFMSIHYANNNDKQVCVGCIGFMQQEFSSLRLKIHIDGGQGASGAPLFNIEGHVVAILQSSQRDETRNFLPIQRILLELDYYNVHFELELQLIVEKNEGEHLKAFLIERYGFGHSNETVTSFNTMLYKNSDRLRLALFHGLGHGGVHKETSKWSLRGYIESDHFPAYSAYDRRDMSRDLFPAITIPKVIHNILLTTLSERFRSTQREYIRAKNCYQAIVENFRDYKEKGLFTRSNYDCTEADFESLLVEYRTGFNKALKVHKKLKLISEDRRNNLKLLISDCIREGRNTGNELRPDHRIRIRSNSVPR